MKKYFRNLFKYNDWANQQFLITLENNSIKNDRVIVVFGHMISAQIIWLNRIKELPTSPFPLWERYKVRELKSMVEESSRNWLNYLDEHQLETFEEMIYYSNSKGIKYESTIGDIITHVIAHSAYHRGQVATLLKDEGIQPPVTDFIHFKRVIA